MKRRRGFSRLRWAWWRDVYRPPANVTPDPDAAAALERQRKNIEYSPSGGFIKDNKQGRIDSE